MEKILKGPALKLGEDVNTDIIVPSKFMIYIEPEELGKHALEGYGADFPPKLKNYKLIVAGENFGCGSAREQAVTCLKGAGLLAVVAKSFARTFFRNAINLGFPVVACPEVVDAVNDGEEITVDLAAGCVWLRDQKFSFPPLPPFLMEMLEAGGLEPRIRNYISQAG